MPGAVGMDVTGVYRGVHQLSELGNAGFCHQGGTSGAVGGDGTVVPGEVGALEIAQAGSAVAGAGAANEKEAHVFRGAGDQFPVEALADEKGEAVIAEGPYAGEQAAMPKSVDGGGWDVETDGGAGFADVLVAESGT